MSSGLTPYPSPDPIIYFMKQLIAFSVLVGMVLLAAGVPSMARCLQGKSSKDSSKPAQEVELTSKTEVITILVRGMMKSRSGAT